MKSVKHLIDKNIDIYHNKLVSNPLWHRAYNELVGTLFLRTPDKQFIIRSIK